MDWRTSDEQPNPECISDGRLARDSGERSLAGLSITAVSRHCHGLASLDSTFCRALQLARDSGGRFGGEDLSE
jgi:hypothetical protein